MDVTAIDFELARMVVLAELHGDEVPAGIGDHLDWLDLSGPATNVQDPLALPHPLSVPKQSHRSPRGIRDSPL